MALLERYLGDGEAELLTSEIAALLAAGIMPSAKSLSVAAWVVRARLLSRKETTRE